MVHIGKAIAWGRKSIGLTKAQFADQIGCDRSWVYRLEIGGSCPSHDFVKSAAKMFGCHNVEQMECGGLPARLSSMTGSQMKGVRRLLQKVPNAEQELELAIAGVRLPSEQVLLALANHLTDGSVEELLYGGAEKREARSERLEVKA